MEKSIYSFFSTYTTLTPAEHISFLMAVKHFIHHYKESYTDVLLKLGANNFQRISKSDYFKLCTVSREDWIRLIKLTEKYDLDEKKYDFYTFDASRGKQI